MSPREWQVLCWLAHGYNATHIAARLKLTRNYIYSIVRLLKARFATETSVGIVSRAKEEGLIFENQALCDEEQP
jgi:DNA-binding CsgD family transcriptional regulator